jgi:RND superfamily putative drug exporter
MARLALTDEKPRWLASLGKFCAGHAVAIVSAWALAVVLASVGATRLPDLLFSGSGDIPGSMSLHVDELLRSEFANPHAQLLVLALRSPGLDREPQDAAKLLDALKGRWKEDPRVADVIIDADIADQRLRPLPGTGHVAIASLKARNLRESEQEIPRLRAAAERLLRAAQAVHPDLSWAITGRAALTYDLNRFNSEDTTKAELRALPLTLLILVFAFGSLVAAALPLVLGLTSTTLALGLVCGLAHSVVLSSLVQNVASMIGLALGIDYSLFLIDGYRREIRRLSLEQPALPRPRLQEMALELAMSSAGAVVLYSGLTVLIGMAGLIATPLVETRSLGLGGCTVVAVAVLAALTLLPALLTLLGAGVLEWPVALSRRLHGEASRARWTKWADGVTRHPAGAAIGSLSILLLLAAPGSQTRFGFPEAQFLPAELEYARGMELLRAMDLKGLLSPLPVILTCPRRLNFDPPCRANFDPGTGAGMMVAGCG